MQRADVEEIVRQYLADHPEALGPAVQKYLADHPEAIRDALTALAAKRTQAQAVGTEKKQAITDNAKALFDAPLQTTLGPAEGSATVVEFFDFNCGFCRRALADTLALMRDDASLRIVLKEFPILGSDSVDAARIAIALCKQNPDPAKALEFHRRLLASQRHVDRAAALAVAHDLGFDTAQLETDAAGAEVNEALQLNYGLAQTLGIHSTPTYVVGDRVIAGAVGDVALRARIADTRKP
jgi:protein-disulfide isomerase